MKTLLLSLFLLGAPHIASSSVASSSQKPSTAAPTTYLATYFQLLDQYPQTLGPDGRADLGEIEIVRDVAKIADIEKSTGRQVGIIFQDKYWIWVNDAVKFPTGKYGVYGRILWVQSLTGIPGVAVMPVLPNGKIAMNRNYRHSTRSWEYELPRGGVNVGEKIEDAAIREVKEETGMRIGALHNLGTMTPDTGFTNTIVPVFMAKVIKEEAATPDDSEAIAAIEAFTVEELKKGFIDGYLVATVEGKPTKIPLRDPFLTYALFQASIRNLLPSP